MKKHTWPVAPFFTPELKAFIQSIGILNVTQASTFSKLPRYILYNLIKADEFPVKPKVIYTRKIQIEAEGFIEWCEALHRGEIDIRKFVGHQL